MSEYDLGGVGAFVASRVRRSAVASTSAARLYEAYLSWGASEGLQGRYLATAASFGRRLRQLGLESRKSNGRVVYLGVDLPTN